MGAYLASPLTDKESTDELNELLSCGASQMQGWRMSQEDAHICSLDFDTDTSLFAVFDGHGGSEVALYCSQKLPNFLKQLDAYKTGQFDQALKDAFIGFDATLVNDDVIEEMKKLIPEKARDMSTDSDDEAEDEDINELYKEGRMPLTELLKKLRSGGSALANLSGGGGSSSGTATVSAEEDDKIDSAPSCFGRRKRKSIPTSSDNDNDILQLKSCLPEDATGIDDFGVTSSSSVSDTASEKKEKPKQDSECGSSNDAASKEIVKPKADEANSSGSVSSSSTSKIAAEGGNGSGNSLNDNDTDDTDEDEEEDEDESTDSDSDTSKGKKEHREDDWGAEDDEELEDEIDTDEESDDDYPTEYEDDEKFLNGMFEGPGSSSGCTAVVALLKGNDLYVANAGDSRCVVCRDGKAMDMSFDHKPEDKEELERIHKAGGRVTMDGRVNGGLNLSRAIGDHAYKTNKELKAEEQMISALPDVKHTKIGSKDEFMILACDGIWNSFTSEEVVAFVRDRIQKGEKKMSAICEELFTKCLAPNTCGDGTGCDNMTAVIIQFQKPLTERFHDTDKAVEDETTKKRQISPVTENEAADTNTSKRMKTDENHESEEINAEVK